MKRPFYRQGDVGIIAVDEIPKGAELKEATEIILAKGEATGHAHMISNAQRNALLYMYKNMMFLKVVAEAVRIQHEEHNPIMLPMGNWQIINQREYTPQEIRNVRD